MLTPDGWVDGLIRIVSGYKTVDKGRLHTNVAGTKKCKHKGASRFIEAGLLVLRFMFDRSTLCELELLLRLCFFNACIDFDGG